MAELTETIEVRPNPHSGDGQYGTPEKLAFLDAEYKRVKAVYDMWVQCGRMHRSSRDHKLGILESLIHEMQTRQLLRLPLDLSLGPAVAVNFRSHADAADFEERAPALFSGICAIRPA